jgi:geranylgeranyl diphosphate synthase, type I
LAYIHVQYSLCGEGLALAAGVPVVWKNMDIAEFKKVFEPVFTKYVKECLKEMRSRLKDPMLRTFMEQVAKIALAGGKRARPFLVYSMYKISGGKNEEVAMRIAMSVEMFHIFCLIHDDITDRGQLRHGQVTVHEYAAAALRKARRRGDLAHISESQAMLAGDLVYAWAYERLAGLKGVEEKAHVEALKVFNEAMQDVIAGQMIDVDLTTRVSAPTALVFRKMELKTASYTFIRPLELGAALAGASAEVRTFCRNFGKEMGVGFQLQDDLLDIVGTTKRLGKRPLGDVREGQHTPLSQHAFQHANVADGRFLARVFGKGTLSVRDAQRVREIFVRTGALAYAEGRIRKHFARAERLLQSAPIEERGKEVLTQLLHFVAYRTA